MRIQTGTLLVLLSVVACGGSTIGTGSGDSGASSDAGSDAARQQDASILYDGGAPDTSKRDDGAGPDGGPFACGNGSCDPATQLCAENTTGGTVIAQCLSLPQGCEHDCACIKMTFQCPVRCTNDNGLIRVVCGP
jgi:hypothetical protein